MAAESVLNTVQSTVNMGAGVSAADVSIVVADGSGFAVGFPFRASINDEILLVTNVVGNVLTVVRGEEGTIATAHANGAAVSSAFTAGGLLASFAVLAGLAFATVRFSDLLVDVGNARHAVQIQSDNINDYQDVAANADSRCAVVYLGVGTYKVYRMGWHDSNMGILDVRVDGGLVGSTDLYSGAGGHWSADFVGSVTVSEGHHLVRCTVNGKNGASSAYYCLHSMMWFGKV